MLASIWITRFVTMDRDGEKAPGALWWIHKDDFVEALCAGIDAAYPGWPDFVQSYREWQIELSAMWAGIADRTSQVLTALAHNQAYIDAAKEDLRILDEPRVAAMPATRLYLDACKEFLLLLSHEPSLAKLKDVPESVERLSEAGQKAMYGIWSRLGLTIELHDDRQWGLLVGEPTWLDDKDEGVTDRRG